MASGRKIRESKTETSRRSTREAHDSRLSKRTVQETSGSERSSLTERDMRLGRVTWFKNVDTQSDFGLVIFKELFKQFPDVESYFFHLRGNSKDIFDSRAFRSHMTERVVPKLKEIFEALDRPEELHDIMTKLGLYHAKMRVPQHLIRNMVGVIVDSLKSVMAHKMQPDEELALKNCLQAAFAITLETIDKYEKKNPVMDF
uniref:Globin domain-containing protein n=1 Tax=Graphocephala atropunctata TaxID=36148 RepID=A0A1B6MUV8_9HEMI